MTRARGRWLAGTSGFAYEAWRGSFYPRELPAKEMLRFYAGRFRSVEINYTFRRFPSARTLAAWRGAVPAGFVFAVKAHQRITHQLRLREAGDAVREFVAALEVLGDRVGPILFQCPPGLKYDGPRLEAFLDALPPGFRYAFEFRHPSWEAARPLLTDRGAAWCHAETDAAPVPDEAVMPSPFHYLRLRKTEYAAGELARWAAWIGACLRRGEDVCCYFKHEDSAKGPAYAARLSELVDSRRAAKEAEGEAAAP